MIVSSARSLGRVMTRSRSRRDSYITARVRGRLGISWYAVSLAYQVVTKGEEGLQGQLSPQRSVISLATASCHSGYTARKSSVQARVWPEVSCPALLVSTDHALLPVSLRGTNGLTQ